MTPAQLPDNRPHANGHLLARLTSRHRHDLAISSPRPSRARVVGHMDLVLALRHTRDPALALDRPVHKAGTAEGWLAPA